MKKSAHRLKNGDKNSLDTKSTLDGSSDPFMAHLQMSWELYCNNCNTFSNMEDHILRAYDLLAHRFLYPHSVIKKIMYLINSHIPLEVRISMKTELRNDVFVSWLTKVIASYQEKCEVLEQPTKWNFADFLDTPATKEHLKPLSQEKARKISFLLYEMFLMVLCLDNYFEKFRESKNPIVQEISELLKLEKRGLTRKLQFDDGSKQDGLIDFALRKGQKGRVQTPEEKNKIAAIANYTQQWVVHEYMIASRLTESEPFDFDLFGKEIKNALFQASKYLAAPKSDAIKYLANETSEIVKFDLINMEFSR